MEPKDTKQDDEETNDPKKCIDKCQCTIINEKYLKFPPKSRAQPEKKCKKLNQEVTEPQFSGYKATQLEAVPINPENSTAVSTFNNSSSQNVAEQTNSIPPTQIENDLWTLLGGGSRAVEEVKEFYNQLREEPLIISSMFIFLSYYIIHFIVYCGFFYECHCFFW